MYWIRHVLDSEHFTFTGIPSSTLGLTAGLGGCRD